MLFSNLRYQCPKTGINSRYVRVPWTESGLEVIKQSLDIQDTGFADHCSTVICSTAQKRDLSSSHEYNAGDLSSRNLDAE